MKCDNTNLKSDLDDRVLNNKTNHFRLKEIKIKSKSHSKQKILELK
jgi:hypothetical protein